MATESSGTARDAILRYLESAEYALEGAERAYADAERNRLDAQEAESIAYGGLQNNRNNVASLRKALAVIERDVGE